MNIEIRFCVYVFWCLLHKDMVLATDDQYNCTKTDMTKRCPDGWVDDDHADICLKAVDDNVVFDGVPRACEKFGGEPLMILSEDTQHHVEHVLHGKTQKYWIGLSDQKKEGEFLWQDKKKTPLSSSTYSNFKDLQENDEHKNCVAIDSSASNTSKWILESCNDRMSYMCMKLAVPDPERPKVTIKKGNIGKEIQKGAPIEVECVANVSIWGEMHFIFIKNGEVKDLVHIASDKRVIYNKTETYMWKDTYCLERTTAVISIEKNADLDGTTLGCSSDDTNDHSCGDHSPACTVVGILRMTGKKDDTGGLDSGYFSHILMLVALIAAGFIFLIIMKRNSKKSQQAEQNAESGPNPLTNDDGQGAKGISFNDEEISSGSGPTKRQRKGSSVDPGAFMKKSRDEEADEEDKDTVLTGDS